MKFVAAIVLAFVPCSAYAAPVYLKCQLDQDVGKSPAWDVTLNEDAGTVTYLFPDSGRAYTVRGVFTAEKVTFNGFTVDRTNFGFERDMSGLQVSGRPPMIDRGKCTIAVAKRAF